MRRGYVTVKLEQQSERVPPSQVDPTLAPPTDAGRIHGVGGLDTGQCPL